MVTLTWTSMNISTYQAQVHLALQQLEDLIIRMLVFRFPKGGIYQVFGQGLYMLANRETGLSLPAPSVGLGGWM